MNVARQEKGSCRTTWRVSIAAACLTALVWCACPSVDAGVMEEENITYGKGGDRELKLDLARPEGDGPFPALVFIHGGGWRGGQRSGYRGEIVEAAKRGYVAVTVSYRLTEPDEQGKAKYPFPAQVHDVKCAVRWLRADAARYHVDPNRIGATGGSAGGHLSLMLGLTDAEANLEGDGGHAEQSSRVQAVVNYFGPTDMIELSRGSDGAAPIVASFLGGTPEDVRDRYLAASPTTYVSRDDPPILSLHGADDRLVPPDQARALDKKMAAAGASHTLILLEGQGHGFHGEASAQARTAMYEFFNKHLKLPADLQ
ncbi:MAG TPA: alpha/beta hydrolase [Thermoguttaceae bacterium]|nr:alpha/beta hydrolase [Thermoguttaceae bacterium]